ncbi:T9SS type A sorting domain-containing protein [Hymenobacter artigasi]|uniref:Secretion system C-terminal sorting domain-containing protein n=1 Tax=Hymenobacter artigasi TaxID=2719616 RepID=A0ABX1HP63_9BACT|nr:T9SS type A sorting domain-containing protein [Hymenobacter artigasi]NKI91694.1 hypothetical protein [Hymenobacter artigasi]
MKTPLYTSLFSLAEFSKRPRTTPWLTAWLWRMALVLVVGLGLAPTPARAQNPGVGGTQAGFEIDAHFSSGIIPSFWTGSGPNQNYFPSVTTFGDDWSQGLTGSAMLKQVGGVSVTGATADARGLWQVDGNWGTSSAIGELSVFAGSSNKNGDAIGTGQSPYSVGTGSGGPQKNDITNTFLHSRQVDNKLWLFFGAETRSVNGASYLDFEYNQAGVKKIGNQLVGQGPLNGRTLNDFLLVINYTGGGNKPVVGVRRWVAPGTWSNELPVSTLGAFVTTNTADVAPVAPNKAFTSDGAFSNTTGALQFVEGGLNVTDVFRDSPLDQCTPLATITVKTRSSPSYTSELKDYDVLSFPLTPSATATVADVPAQCKPISGSTVFSVSGTYGNGTPTWSASSGVVLSNQSYSAGVATATASVAGNGPETVTLTTASSNSACPSAVASKPLNINPTPVGTNTTMSSCPTSIGGPTAVFDLTSKNGTVTGGVTGVTVVGWYEGYNATTGAFTGSIASPTTYTSGSKTVYAQLSGTGSCLGVAQNALTLMPSPVGTNAMMSSCPTTAGGTTAVFDLTSKNGTVTGGVVGVTVAGWYETYAAGAFSNPITSPVTYTSGSKTVYAQLSGASSCLGVAQNALTLTPSPGRPDVTITEATLCGTLLAPSLTVNSPVTGTTYTLTQTGVAGSRTFAYPADGTTVVFLNLVAGKGFSIIATNAGCVSAATDCSNYTQSAPVGRSVPTVAPSPQQSIQTEAYPNPTSKDATINFSVPKTGHVLVSVYDALGRPVATLFDGEATAGEQRSVVLKGASLASGIYTYRVVADGKTRTNRVSLEK